MITGELKRVNDRSACKWGPYGVVITTRMLIPGSVITRYTTTVSVKANTIVMDCVTDRIAHAIESCAVTRFIAIPPHHRAQRPHSLPVTVKISTPRSHFIMVALCNRADHYIFILWFLLSFFFFFLFSSSNLSRRRLDVYHTSTHGVALVRI